MHVFGGWVGGSVQPFDKLLGWTGEVRKDLQASY